MVTSSLHVLVWEEDGEELLILTSVQEMIVHVSGRRPHILMLASVEWPVFFCRFFYLWNKLPEGVEELEYTRWKILLAFYRIHPSYSRKIDEGYVSGLSIIYSSNPHQHIWTLTTYILVMMKQQTINSIVLVLYTTAGYSPPSYVGSTVQRKILAGENFGEFGESKIFCQYFTALNLSFNLL